MQSVNRATIHRDGTVTYWSVFAQTWRRRVRYISLDDAIALPSHVRARVLRACADASRREVAPGL